MNESFYDSVDFAQVMIYLFWIFFAGLVFYIRREDRREGFPLETVHPRRVLNEDNPLIPTPKRYALPEGGEYLAPSFERDERPIEATQGLPTSPYDPVGTGMGTNIGPSSFAERDRHPERTYDGHNAIVPMRVATDYSVTGGSDPRGWDVVAIDGEVVGKVTDIWVDRPEMQARYIEVELADGSGSRLMPMTMGVTRPSAQVFKLEAMTSEQFPGIPQLEQADEITVHEEELISAYFAGGRLYATPKRVAPLI
ncbi:MAG: photosynthetic reaction center subunit H [Myxococcota bacterium]